MLPMLRRVLALLAVAFVVMQATALFLFVFFGVAFAHGYTAGAVIGVVAAALYGWLLWRLDEDQGRAAPRRPGS